MPVFKGGIVVCLPAGSVLLGLRQWWCEGVCGVEEGIIIIGVACTHAEVMS